jgi:hypothetical protein
MANPLIYSMIHSFILGHQYFSCILHNVLSHLGCLAVGWSCINIMIPHFTWRIGGTMIFPSGVVVVEAVTNFFFFYILLLCTSGYRTPHSTSKYGHMLN